MAKTQPPWKHLAAEDRGEKSKPKPESTDPTPGTERKATPTKSKAPIPDNRLPDWKFATDLIAEDLPEPPVIIGGILHQAELMMIGGTAKSRKTWTFIDLAASVATGTPWWEFETTQGLVVYIDFELQPWAFSNRLNDVLTARQEAGLDCDLGKQLIHWPLRGEIIGLDDGIVSELIRRLGPLKPAAIIFDPIYRVLGDRNESSAAEIAGLMNLLQHLAEATNAAVILGHHFSKGNKSATDSIDRFSGSGVWGRFADTLFTMTQHEDFLTDGSLTVDIVTRNFPPTPQFVVLPAHPLMVRDSTGKDPKKLKGVGAPKLYSHEDIFDLLLKDGPFKTMDWFRASENVTGLSKNTFFELREQLRRQGRVQLIEKEWHVVNSTAPEA